MLPRLAEGLCLRAELAISMSNLPRAREDAEKAKRIFQDRDDLAGWALVCSGFCSREMMSQMLLPMHCTTAVLPSRDSRQPDVVLRGQAWKLQGECHTALDEKENAVHCLEEGLQYAKIVNAEFVMAECERCLGEVKITHVIKGEQGPRFSEAHKHLSQALLVYEGFGSKIGQANTHRALAALYQATGHPRHRRKNLEKALQFYDEIKHRLGSAVVKAELASLKLKADQKEDARKLIGDSLSVLQDVNRRFHVADRTGLMVTEGKEMTALLDTVSTLRVEDDPFWQKNLENINHKPTRHQSAGDVVREVLGSYALDIDKQQNSENIFSVRVGHIDEPGLEYLNGVHCYEEGRGWEYADDADNRAFDEVLGWRISRCWCAVGVRCLSCAGGSM